MLVNRRISDNVLVLRKRKIVFKFTVAHVVLHAPNPFDALIASADNSNSVGRSVRLTQPRS